MNYTWKTTRNWLWRIVRFAAVLSVVAGVVYWVKFAPVSVSEYTVERGSIVAEVMGTGTLEARVETTISPKIAGRIENVIVDQGERVLKGDLLVRLDDGELQQQVAIAQANEEAATAAIERLKADRNRATAVFEQAQRNHLRIASLVKQNVANQDDLDRSTEALAVAAAGVARAEAAITEGQKGFVAAQKTLEYHRARLKDTRIDAPFDGLIVKRDREPGDVVVPGSSILTLISTDELWINTWVDETEMARLQETQQARAVFRSEPDRSYPGAVVRLGKETDRETREFVVDVRVLELPKNWAVGQRAEAFIEVDQNDDVVVLPAKLLVSQKGEDGVFLNVDGIATWRPVTLGLRSRDAVEILDGLQESDVVVTPKDQRTALSHGKRLVMP